MSMSKTHYILGSPDNFHHIWLNMSKSMSTSIPSLSLQL